MHNHLSYCLIYTSFGLLHRIPIAEAGQHTEDFVAAHVSPEQDYEEQQLFVPADAHADTVFDIDADTFDINGMPFHA